jgi:hypothetical protein
MTVHLHVKNGKSAISFRRHFLLPEHFGRLNKNALPVTLNLS